MNRPATRDGEPAFVNAPPRNIARAIRSGGAS